MKEVSVVIPCYIISDETEELTKQCINSFRKTLKGVDWELIIVNDCSTQGVEHIMNEADIYITNLENLGYAKTMNKGWEKATGKYIVTVNNDVEVYDGWFSDFKNLLSEREAGLVGGLGHKEKEMYGRHISEYRDIPSLSISRVTEGGKLSDWMFPGGFFMMTRDAFNKLGYFDERYLTGVEDIDYFYRARLQGIKMVMTESVRYWHKEGATREATEENRKKNRINHLKNIAKFEEKWGFNCCSEMYTLIFKEE